MVDGPVDSPVAFVCAMPMELRPLTKRLGLRPAELGGGPARTGRLDGRPVVAIVTGMGTFLAAAGVQRLLDAVTPAQVVVFGITGAVDDETPIGALILPERVIDHASGREHEHHLLGPGRVHGALWTTDVITPAADLPALRARGVVALDMETAAIAQACEDDRRGRRRVVPHQPPGRHREPEGGRPLLRPPPGAHSRPPAAGAGRRTCHPPGRGRRRRRRTRRGLIGRPETGRVRARRENRGRRLGRPRDPRPLLTGPPR